ncbi:MAG: LacI family DNA-binding transcriptional regulator [Armatimonadota bacterium]
MTKTSQPELTPKSDVPQVLRTSLPSGPATIRDVARESGVSIGTVSNVFNNSTDSIRPETRDRVVEAARRLRYRPNGVARGLVQRRTQTLGILFHAGSAMAVSDPYTSAILHGILQGCVPKGYSTLLYPKSFSNGQYDLNQLADGRADGLLVVAPGRDDTAASALTALGVPVVVVSARQEPKDGILSVDVDNERGGYLATQYLLSLGHRRIAHLSGDPRQRSAYDREAGFRAAMAAEGVAVEEAFVIPCGYHGGEACEPTNRLLRLPHPPTAIFCANDNLAIGVLLAAREAEVSVPEKLSIIGFDDAPAAALITPPLTTIRQPLSEIGRRAAESLIEKIELRSEERKSASEADGIAATLPVVLDPTLVVRGSTAAPLSA